MKGLLTVLLTGMLAVTAAGAGARTIVFQGAHGAKAIGMGGAFTALADDGTGALWNPAGLTAHDEAWLAGASSDLYAGGGPGMAYHYVAAGVPLGRYALGLAWGNATAGLLYSTSAVFGTAGMRLAGLGTVGVSLKYYSETIDRVTKGGLGLDLGLKASLTPAVHIGVLAQDIGGTGLGASTVEPGYKLGMAVVLLDDALTLATDMYLMGAGFQLVDLRAGIEVRLLGRLALRGGAVVPNGAISELYVTLGAGFALGGLALDAAYVLDQTAGQSLVLSAGFILGTLFAEPEPQPEVPDGVGGPVNGWDAVPPVAPRLPAGGLWLEPYPL